MRGRQHRDGKRLTVFALLHRPAIQKRGIVRWIVTNIREACECEYSLIKAQTLLLLVEIDCTRTGTRVRRETRMVGVHDGASNQARNPTCAMAYILRARQKES